MIIFQCCSLLSSSNTTYWNLECTGSAYAVAPHLNFLEFSSDAAKVFLRTTRSYEEKVRTGEVPR